MGTGLARRKTGQSELREKIGELADRSYLTAQSNKSLVTPMGDEAPQDFAPIVAVNAWPFTQNNSHRRYLNLYWPYSRNQRSGLVVREIDERPAIPEYDFGIIQR